MKILVIVTSNDKLKQDVLAGYYLPEVVDFVNVMSEHNIECVYSSPKGGKAPMFSRDEFMKDIAENESIMIIVEKLDNTVTLSSITPDDYSGVFFVGGFACLFDIPTDEFARQIAEKVYQNNGVLSAVCHGTSALLNINDNNGTPLIEGKRVTGRTLEEDTGRSSVEDVLRYFPFIVETELRNKGALFSKSEPFTPHVQTDSRIVTGQGVSSTVLVAKSVVDILEGNTLP